MVRAVIVGRGGNIEGNEKRGDWECHSLQKEKKMTEQRKRVKDRKEGKLKTQTGRAYMKKRESEKS